MKYIALGIATSGTIVGLLAIFYAFTLPMPPAGIIGGLGLFAFSLSATFSALLIRYWKEI